MPLKTYPIRLIILLVLLSGCGPLVPLTYDAQTGPANLAQTIESPEASIIVEYIQRQNGYDIYDLEVINQSPTPLQLAPQNITFYSSSKLFPPIKNSTDDVRALSEPYSKLLTKRSFADSPWEVRKVYQQKAKQKAGASVILAVLATALVIYDEVQDAKGYKKETWTKKDARRADGRELLTNVAITAAQVARADAVLANEDNFYVPYELFPESTIAPCESVRGKIFIRVENYYRFSRLVIPLADTDFVFDLKRRGVKSKSKD